MCAYLFWSKSKLIDKVKELEFKNNTLKHMLQIKEEEFKIKEEIIKKYQNQNTNQKPKTNSTYLWR